MLTIKKGLPEEAGIPSSSIIRFLERLNQYQIPMHSIHIMRHDLLIAEGYYYPYEKNMLHRMFSISKSLTSLAIGKLADEGFLHLDDPIIQYFPEYVPKNVHPWVAHMTIRHMLMMRSCHSGTTYKLNIANNWVESFFKTEPTHKPGTVYQYDTSASHTLCALVEKITKKPLLEYLRETILEEIGFSKNSYMLKDPFGISMGGSGLMATSEDMLRLGYLLMHKGNIDGKQLIDPEYLENAISWQSSNAMTGSVISERQGYGYQFWRGQYNSFVCYGMGGQLIICLPDYNLLCVTTADTQQMQGGNQIIYNCFYEEILASLCQDSLPTNSLNDTDYKILQNKLKSLCIQPLSILQKPSNYAECNTIRNTSLLPESYSILHNINGRKYILEQNKYNFQSFTLDLTENQGVLKYDLNGQSCEIPFGYDKVITSRFPEYQMQCASSGMWLDQNSFYIKVHLLDTSVGSIQFLLVFDEDDLTISLQKIEESLFHEYTGYLYGISAR